MIILASSWIQNLLQLIGVIIVFILVLVATYFTTKFVGKSGIVQKQSSNIQVVETFKIAPNKYIQIIRLGAKYYAISVSKDNINFLSELSEEQLEFSEEKATNGPEFKDIMERLSAKLKNKKKDE